MPMRCAAEVHFSSVERMQIRELFSIGHFFFFKRGIHFGIMKTWISMGELRVEHSCSQADGGPRISGQLLSEHPLLPCSENSVFSLLSLDEVRLTFAGVWLAKAWPRCVYWFRKSVYLWSWGVAHQKASHCTNMRHWVWVPRTCIKARLGNTCL